MFKVYELFLIPHIVARAMEGLNVCDTNDISRPGKDSIVVL